MDIIKPMLAVSANFPDNDDEYGFEIKWDGMRAILYCQNGYTKIFSRNQKEITSQYPELKQIGVSRQRIILDGEIVCFDHNGKPSFAGLQHRMGLSEKQNIEIRMREYPVTYVIFDLLFQEGKSMLDLPYTTRRELLQNLKLQGKSWQTPEYKKGCGREMLVAIQQLGLEGIMAKRLVSHYIPGARNGDWLKIKNKKRQEFVIGGWIPGKNARSGQIGALILGYYEQQQFVYAGRVGTGFNVAQLERLQLLLSPHIAKQNPFSNNFPYKEAVFVRPNFVCEVEFTEWTPHNTLRHPSFKGLRMDKAANEVKRET